VEKLAEPLREIDENGIRRYYMSVGHINEVGTQLRDRVADFYFSGMRGYSVTYFHPWIADNPKWIQYLDGSSWPEYPIRKLVRGTKVAYVGDITFEQRSILRAREMGELTEGFTRTQNLDILNADKIEKLREYQAQMTQIRRKIKN